MNQKTLIIIFILVCFNLVLSQEIWEIDKRNRTDANGLYSIVFVARSSSGSGFPGHGYVVWGHEDKSKHQSWQCAFGFYADSGDESSGSLKAVYFDKGNIWDEITKNGKLSKKDKSEIVILKKVIVKINKDVFDQTIAILLKWINQENVGQGEYSILSDLTCLTFLKEIGEKCNLNMPKSWITTPAVYVENIYVLNK